MSSTTIPAPHPIELTVGGDLTRSRLTVFFRGILVIPHLLFLYLWGVVAVLTSLVAWIVAMFIGRLPDPLHRFQAAYVRYGARVVAYWWLIADPFPPFSGSQGRGRGWGPRRPPPAPALGRAGGGGGARCRRSPARRAGVWSMWWCSRRRARAAGGSSSARSWCFRLRC